jgi:hypothetical protein
VNAWLYHVIFSKSLVTEFIKNNGALRSVYRVKDTGGNSHQNENGYYTQDNEGQKSSVVHISKWFV